MRHRTQILLDDFQYQALKEEAHHFHVSFSSLIRQGINLFLASVRSERKSHKSLKAFAGIIRDKKAASMTNREIDQIIYRKDWS